MELVADDTVYAQATVDFESRSDRRPLPLDEIRGRCPHHVDPGVICDGMAQRGLNYGPSFRGLEKVWVGNGEALAELRRPGVLAGLSWDPALLDAALQATVVLLAQSTGRLLPQGADSVELVAALPDSCVVHVSRLSADKYAVRFDLTLASHEGQVLLRIGGLTLGTAMPKSEAAIAPTAERPGLLFLEPRWTVAGGETAPVSGPVVVLGAPQPMIASLSAAGAVPFSLQGAEPASLKSVLDSLPSGPVRAVSFVAPDGPLPGLIALCQAMLRHRPGDRLDLVQVVDAPDGAAGPSAVAVAGFARSLRLETPRLSVRSLRLPPSMSPSTTAEAVLRELAAEGDAAEVRLTSAGRETKGVETVIPPPPADWLPRGGVCVITGGAGGVGSLVALHVAKCFGARIALAGRSPQGPPTAALLAHLKAEGAADALYVRADIASSGGAEALVATVRERLGPIEAVLHAAGVTRDALLPGKSADDIAAVLAPKIDGAKALDAATREEPLAAFVLFSSACAELGNRGQTDYAYANSWLDAFAAHREADRAAGRRRGVTRSINWPLWEEGSMRPDPAALQWMKAELGLLPLATADALDALDRAMAHDAPQLMVLAGDTEKLRARLTEPPAQRVAPRPVLRVPQNEVVEAVLSAIADALHIPREELRADAALEGYGLTSMTAMEVLAALEPQFGAL
ncbi:MAG: type I polyketide synthase, partial [Pseudomonadota bacterium]